MEAPPLFVLDPDALALILRHEALNQPKNWPGGHSGITLGWGYDLAHCTRSQFWDNWRGVLPTRHLYRLAAAIGVSGRNAAAMASRFRDIPVSEAEATDIFQRCSVPRYWALTCDAFPGVEALTSNVQGALFSLVYNRGTSMDGDRRREMRAIRNAVPLGDLPEIAKQLRLMKRIWQGQGLGGLLRRREDEACLVEKRFLEEIILP